MTSRYAKMWKVFGLLTIIHAARCLNYSPKANPKAIAQVTPNARFTILTSRLIRMEWTPTDNTGMVEFNDDATFVFVDRFMEDDEVPKYTVTNTGENGITIKTDYITVNYKPDDSAFTGDNIQVVVKFNGNTTMWFPQPAINQTLDGNLMGTIRTLDGANGERTLDCYNQNDAADLHCTLGLISTNGYVVVDDTNSPRFTGNDWPWVMNRSLGPPDQQKCNVDPYQRIDCGYIGIHQFDCEGKGCCYDSGKISKGMPKCYYGTNTYRDWYFFGYGHNYTDALRDFTKVSGKIPIPPRFAFGIYFSHYWAYSDFGEMEIVDEYQQRGIPLDVLVTDMDWHITFYKEAALGKKDQSGHSIGWTGFTWDKHLFPDASGFLDWCETHNIKNTLNLHPASGVQPWEDTYKEIAMAMGINPSTNDYVPLDITNVTFTTNWFKIVLGARVKEGIDFWWLDWQQGEEVINIPGVNPTFWLNHIFFTNPIQFDASPNYTRPFILHRWGGLGNHRYQVGFSGDVIPSWDSLSFQVYFTLTASNVAFVYWSHDIGGFVFSSPPELYTRWVQWGIYSPLFRTHCMKNYLNDRRIWVYPYENYKIMRNAMRHRAAMVPYIYTEARAAYDTGLGIVKPMYYWTPESPHAYSYKDQYIFGSQIIVSPIVAPMDNITELAAKSIWLPEGTFVCWSTGEWIEGNVELSKRFTLSETPVFVKTGSIIPMKPDNFDVLGSAQVIPDVLKLMVFPGVDPSEYTLYEDDGHTTKYQATPPEYATQSFSMKTIDQYTLQIAVGAYDGYTFDGRPESRGYEVHIFGCWPAKHIQVDQDTNINYTPWTKLTAGINEDYWTYDGSTRTLIIGLSKRPTNAQFMIEVQVTAALSSDLLRSNYVGQLSRVRLVKQTLDDQWGRGTVYQENYFDLLNAAEVGMKITYSPEIAEDLLKNFTTLYNNGMSQVKRLWDLHADVKAKIIAQLSFV
ncbi:alpha-xylosidase BoGH31A-like isoform X1 [Dysidea avara]|uniref:alpha-xylosidase BoGH31A-like isoform X1 n=2 Tax=Dysidea avara TaxID=196820 RepID=UPI0033231CE5